MQCVVALAGSPHCARGSDPVHPCVQQFTHAKTYPPTEHKSVRKDSYILSVTWTAEVLGGAVQISHLESPFPENFGQRQS